MINPKFSKTRIIKNFLELYQEILFLPHDIPQLNPIEYVLGNVKKKNSIFLKKGKN